MKRMLIATTLCLALPGASLMRASGQAKPDADPKIGTRVTITGCLHKGASGGSFVLLGVTERPADMATPPPVPLPAAIYWLDSNDGLKKLVGEMVDITGKVTGRRPNPGKITISIDPSEPLSTDVQVRSASGGLDVTTKKFEDSTPQTGPAGNGTTLEVTRPVYKLDVENVHPVNVPGAAPACK